MSGPETARLRYALVVVTTVSALFLVAIASPAYSDVSVRYVMRAVDIHRAGYFVAVVSRTNVVVVAEDTSVRNLDFTANAHVASDVLGRAFGAVVQHRRTVSYVVPASFTVPTRLRGIHRFARMDPSWLAAAHSIDRLAKDDIGLRSLAVSGTLGGGVATVVVYVPPNSIDVARMLAELCGGEVLRRGRRVFLSPGAARCAQFQAPAWSACPYLATESYPLDCLGIDDIRLLGIATSGAHAWALLAGRDRGAPTVVQGGSWVLHVPDSPVRWAVEAITATEVILKQWTAERASPTGWRATGAERRLPIGLEP